MLSVSLSDLSLGAESVSAATYPAKISIPNDIDQAGMRLGMSGTVTVFVLKAGLIGFLMSILVWINSYTYL